MAAGAILASSLGLQPVAAASAAGPALSLSQVVSTLGASPRGGLEGESLKRATDAMQFIAKMKLPQASKAINEALQLDASNSYLHFFNGFVYHLQARQGDTDKTSLAVEGYQQATRFDPGNWIAHEFLGLAYLEQKQYPRAQAAFSEVLLLRPNDPVTLTRLMAASYLAGDPKMACAMADQLAAPPHTASSGVLRSSVSVYASCGDFDKADKMQQAYGQQGASRADVDLSAQRLSQWKSFHKSRTERGGASLSDAGAVIKTQWGGAPSGGFGGAGGGGGGGFGGSQGGGFGSPGGSSGFGAPSSPFGSPAPMGAGGGTGGTGGDNPKMVLVDVVMVRTEDSVNTSKGVNLLSALNLQFGGANSQAAFVRTSGTSETTITRAISVPALTYSLNLANANSSLNEVLARPTLAAVEGMRSEFFSGTSLNGGVVTSGGVGSGGSSVSVEKRFGVRLAVVPQILPNGLIKLAIDASRTFLKAPMPYPGFTYKLEISEILANANVVMRMGDTLVLGGLSEKESTNNRDGVPFLQDVPALQYFFSQQSKTEFQRSVLMLITPRPASYTWLSDESKAANAAENNDASAASMDVLRARYGDWFKPYPNLASVFHHLNLTDLYREFRTSDVELERWDRMETTVERLRQALDFLYY